MDSDSDHFESADENFDSEDENVRTEIPKSKTGKDYKHESRQPDVVTQLENITVEEKPNNEDNKKESCAQLEEDNDLVTKNSPVQQIEENQSQSSNENDLVRQLTECQKKDDNCDKKAVVDKKERPKKMKSKLGVKLGTKMSENVNFDETQKDDVKVEEAKPVTDLWEDDFNWTDDLKSNSSNLYSKTVEQSEKSYWKNDEDYMEIPQKEDFSGVADKLSAGDQPQANSSWSSWGNWGVSSLLSTASLGVSTLTNSVSQGTINNSFFIIDVLIYIELYKITKIYKKIFIII